MLHLERVKGRLTIASFRRYSGVQIRSLPSFVVTVRKPDPSEGLRLGLHSSANKGFRWDCVFGSVIELRQDLAHEECFGEARGRVALDAAQAAAATRTPPR